MSSPKKSRDDRDQSLSSLFFFRDDRDASLLSDEKTGMTGMIGIIPEKKTGMTGIDPYHPCFLSGTHPRENPIPEKNGDDRD